MKNPFGGEKLKYHVSIFRWVSPYSIEAYDIYEGIPIIGIDDLT